MVALLVASFIPLVPYWIANLCLWLVIAGAAVYFCWFSRGTIDYGPWRKIFLSVCSVVFLFSIAYGQVRERYQEANIIPPQVSYLTGWGPALGPSLAVAGNPPKVISGIAKAQVTVDGRLLEKYKDKFQLMAVALHVINGESYADKASLSKSDLVRIRNEDILIAIPLNQQYLEEMELGASTTSFDLLAVPKGMKPGDFQTLNEAEDKGAQIIGKGSAGGGIVVSPNQAHP